jgi:hypothetical protein
MTYRQEQIAERESRLWQIADSVTGGSRAPEVYDIFRHWVRDEKIMAQTDSQLAIGFRNIWEDCTKVVMALDPPPDPEQHPLIKEAVKKCGEYDHYQSAYEGGLRQQMLDSIDLWWVDPYKDNLIAASFREDPYGHCLQVYSGDLSVWFDMPFWFVTREEAQKDRLVKDILNRMREKLMRMIDGRDACEDAAGEP